MCRLAMFVGDGDGRNIKECEESFEEMNKRQGGDGMGVAIFIDGKPPEVHKSVKMTAKECATLIANRPEKAGAIWHCRNSTTGTAKDEACHPFFESQNYNDGTTQQVVLAHNGTVMDWSKISKLMNIKPQNDSHILAYMVLWHEWDIVMDWAKWGAIVLANRIISKDKKIGKWKYWCIRLGNGDLRGLPDGGVISDCAKFSGVSSKELPTDKWYELTPGKLAPQVSYTYTGYNGYSGGGAHCGNFRRDASDDNSGSGDYGDYGEWWEKNNRQDSQGVVPFPHELMAAMVSMKESKTQGLVDLRLRLLELEEATGKKYLLNVSIDSFHQFVLESKKRKSLEGIMQSLTIKALPETREAILENIKTKYLKKDNQSSISGQVEATEGDAPVDFDGKTEDKTQESSKVENKSEEIVKASQSTVEVSKDAAKPALDK